MGRQPLLNKSLIMNLYQKIIDEFLLSLSQMGKSPQSAKKCIEWFDRKYFTLNSGELIKEPYSNIRIHPDEFVSEVYENIDMFIEHLCKPVKGRGVSALNYMVKLITTEQGDNALLHNYPNREKGVLYESVLAKILFEQTTDKDYKDANLAVLRVLIGIIIKEVAQDFETWLHSPAEASERYKIIANYEATLPSSSTSFFIETLNLFGGADFVDKAKEIKDMPPEMIARALSTSSDSLAAIAKNNKNEVIQAVHRFITDSDEKMGVFLYISKHPTVAQALLSQPGDKELLVAKLFNSQDITNQSASFEPVWPLLGAWAVKSICADAADFFEKHYDI